MKKLGFSLSLILIVFSWSVIPTFAIRDITPRDTQTESEIEAPIPIPAMERYTELETGFTVEGFPTLGNPNATVLMEDFSSFSCSHCHNFYRFTFLGLIEDYISSGEVFFVYIPIFNTGHIPNGLEANAAAICAGEQEMFFPFAETLYDWHLRYDIEAFLDARLRQGAINIGLDMDEWDSCMASTRPDGVMETALQVMSDRGFSSTPTVLIDNEIVHPALDPVREALDSIIGDRI